MQREVPGVGRMRPADLLVHGWEPEGEAMDVTVRHDTRSTLSRVTGAADSKHINYDGPCRQANLP